MPRHGATLLPLLLALGGCGSLHTLRSEPVVNARELSLAGTYCERIPRLYSGVVYDLCWMHGDPYATQGGYGGAAVTWPLLDMALSGLTDTLALPYTVYRQQHDGSIELVRD